MSDKSQENTSNLSAKDRLLFSLNYVFLVLASISVLNQTIVNGSIFLYSGKVDLYSLSITLSTAFLVWLFYSPFKKRLDKFKQVKSKRAYTILWWVLLIFFIIPILGIISSITLALLNQ